MATQTINITTIQAYATVVVRPLPNENSQDLVFSLDPATTTAFSGAAITPDAVNTGLWYHQSDPSIDTSNIVFYDPAAITGSVANIETVGGTQQNGILELRSSIYYWDEVFTTPLGLFQCDYWSTSFAGDSSSNYHMRFAALNNNDTLNIRIGDSSIIPSVGNYLVLQDYYNPPYTYTNQQSITVDDVNNVPLYKDAEVHIFNIQSVSQVASGAGYIEYQLVLDKTFSPAYGLAGDVAPLYPVPFIVTLLNRQSSDPNKDLFDDTWNLIEVHRQELLGDPYNNTGNLAKPIGRKNHLEYGGAEYVGMQVLLKDIITTTNTPFIVLDINDDVRDRIYSGQNTVEVHLPHIMLQGYTDPVILINTDSVLLHNDAGAGNYGGLYFSGIRYGWVFYDLRIIVLDDAELCTALGYNSNRSYTLPAPQIDTSNIVLNITANEPVFKYFMTYSVLGKHYKDLAPYAITTDFNWNTSEQLSITIPEFTHLLDTSVQIGFEAYTLQVIIGQYTFDGSGNITGFTNLTTMTTVNLKDGGGLSAGPYSLIYRKSNTSPGSGASYTARYSDSANNYTVQNMYGSYGGGTPPSLYTAAGAWLLGFIKYKPAATQYRASFDITIPANKWNSTTNPTFDPTNDLISDKLITEVGLLIQDDTESNVKPMIYGKISPPIRKTNNDDLNITITLDF
jgi:hypothetical protein